MATLKEQIAALDRWIRRGQGRRVRHILKLLCQKNIPRGERAALARIAWRADLPGIGIRLLNPIVRPSARRPTHPTDEEKAEYAHCLNLVGARDEAIRLLEGIDGKRYPQALFYQCAVLIGQWDCKPVIPLLRRYLASPKITPYQALVGRVNLASALSWERDRTAAEALLKRLELETRDAKASFARGHVFELEAFNYLEMDRLKEAESALTRAEELLRKTETDWSFHVRKWKAVLALKRNPQDPSVAPGLAEARREAREKGAWETLRQLDYFEAILRRDRERLVHVHFGTPYESFRRRLLQDWGGDEPLPPYHLWHLGSSPGEPLDLLSGSPVKGRDPLPVGQLLHRLMTVLCSDFYRPLPLATIHALLYPDEFFNPGSSPARVHEAVKRLRLWLKENRLPLWVEEEEGEYHLTATGRCTLKVPADRTPVTRRDPLLEKLKSAWSEKPFSIAEACETLRLHRRTTQRLLEDLCDRGSLERTGKSRATRYHFRS